MTITERYHRVIREHLGVSAAQITDEAEFHADLKADSLDMIELVVAFEDEFHGISISDDDAERVTTVRAGLQLIEDLLEAALTARANMESEA